MPWIGDPKTEEQYIKNNDHHYVFAHTNIVGFNYDNGKAIHKGMDATKIPGIKKLFSGHIHKRQEFQQYIYIGSPYQTKRSDIGNEKGVYIFNPDKNEHKFFPNNKAPVFQKIRLEDILELTLDEAVKLLNNNYTDIIVPNKYIHLFNLTKFIDLLKDCNYKKIETAGERSSIEEELSREGTDIDIKDILTLLEMSIDDLELQMETLVKLKLLNKEYYKKASNEEVN